MWGFCWSKTKSFILQGVLELITSTKKVSSIWKIKFTPINFHIFGEFWPNKFEVLKLSNSAFLRQVARVVIH